MVLIVDDDLDTCEVVHRVLKRRGIESICATSGDKAMAELGKRRPDVIVLDEMMPDQSGTDLMQRLKDDARWADIPVVFYSALFAYEKQKEAEQLGARAWVVKGTVRLDDLANIVAAYALQA